MFLGMYGAASGLVVASEQQEVIAYNLANLNMPGYRQRGVVVESFDRILGQEAEPTGALFGAHTVGPYNDFRPGAVQQTGNPYDLALGEADRFFVLAGPNGPVYTRNGTFFRNAQGQLVSQGGYTLQRENGPVTFPPNTVELTIAQDGTITADGEPAGNLQIVRFTNPAQLVNAGPTLYTAPPGAGLTPAPGRVMQGFRETSNVEPADAMVRLLLGTRYYDAAQRTLRAQAEALQLNTRPSGA